jgi:hypothetical protein
MKKIRKKFPYSFLKFLTFLILVNLSFILQFSLQFSIFLPKASAEEIKNQEERRKNLIISNILQAPFGILGLEYHRGLSKNISIGGSFTYISLGVFKGFRFGPDLGLFPFGKAPEGFNLLLSPGFISGDVGIEKEFTLFIIKIKAEAEIGTLKGLSFPVLLRYNWIFGKSGLGFALSAGAGLHFLALTFERPIGEIKVLGIIKISGKAKVPIPLPPLPIFNLSLGLGF